MSIQTKKTRVLLYSTRILPKGPHKEKALGGGETVDLKGH